MISYLKKFLFFIPLFLLIYGTNTYGLHAKKLYENPFGSIDSEQWVQESPIQFFLGFIVNLFTNNTTRTHWIIVILGFLYLTISVVSFDKRYFSNNQIFKVLYFTPFFLVLFTWMGKPDTFLIGSLFFLVSFSNSAALSFVFILFAVFSHPQIAFIYFLLIKYLNIFNLKINHYFSFILSYIIYFAYLNQLSELESRYSVISQELERVFQTIFTNTLAGFISLFMWLWIVIFGSNAIKDMKFLTSFMIIFLISFFTLDHTRIFMQLSIPLIIYLIKKDEFLNFFNQYFDKKLMYLLGLFQIQKRGDGRIVDGVNLYESEFFKSIFSRIIELIEKFLKNKSISVQPKIIKHIMNYIERTYDDAFKAAEVINYLLYENNHNINLSLISEYYEQIQRPLS